MASDLTWLVVLGATVYLGSTFRKRDFYIVIREFRIVAPNEYGKGKRVESRFVHSFDDYSAAKAFRDLHDSYGQTPRYEDQQNINSLYAVPARSATIAENKMRNKIHHEAKLLMETPHHVLHDLKKYWDEERRARAKNELVQAELTTR